MLQKTPININFMGGEDTKNDPNQVQANKFLSLNNSVFDTLGRLTKTNGLGFLAANPNNGALGISTFKGDLISAGNTVSSYSSDTAEWNSKGAYIPVDIHTTSLIRNNLNQIQCDSVTASNNVTCVVYTETQNNITFTYKYSLLDATTGQSLVAPIQITTSDLNGTPRVFLLGTHFIVLYSGTTGLSYIPINKTTFVAGAPVVISTDYASTAAVSFDGVVAGTTFLNLYIAWNNAAGNKVLLNYLSASLSLNGVVTGDASHGANVLGVCVDNTTPVAPIFWVMYQGVSGSAYALAVDAGLSSILVPTVFDSTQTLTNITGYAHGGICSIFYEVLNSFSFDASLVTRALFAASVQEPSGTVVTGTQINSQMGLGSKAFLFGTHVCIIGSYQSPYQPSYFIFNVNTILAPAAIARLAYSNGGGYLPHGVPQVSSSGPNYYFPYLYKDLVEPVNKQTAQVSTAENPVAPGGVYSQTGINLLTTAISTSVSSVEIGTNLNLTGGFVWAYDGTALTEQNFFLWPELQLNADGTYHGIAQSDTAIMLTGAVVNGSYQITTTTNPVTAGVTPGMTVSGTAIPSGSVVAFIGPGPNTITMTLAATGSHASETITYAGAMAIATYYYVFTYEWTDNQGNVFKSAPSIPISIAISNAASFTNIYVPTLPVTYKTSNPVKITGYRWSSLQQEYFQFTSILTPYLNNPTANDIFIADGASDPSILGNSILYTNGGVVEDIAPPATDTMTLFDTRLWLLDAEDRNLLWFSKQAIEATPLEMSDLFTYYVPPIIGAQGNAGTLTAIFPLDDKLILFRANSIQYINGAGPDNTGANNQYSQPIFISSPVGCANQRSIVVMPKGIMFQSDNGIWLLDHSLNVSYIGAEMQKYNSRIVTSAQTIPGTTQVRFTLSGGPTLMHDYFVEQWGEFSTGGNNYISSTLYQGLHTLLEAGGTIYQETPGVYLNGATPVTISFTTAWIQLAGLIGFQRAYFFYYLGTYLSSHQIQTQIAYNYDPTIVQTDLITPDSTSSTEEQRIFLSLQKCKSFQITFTEINGSGGAGLTLSGLNLIVGVKRGFTTTNATRNVG